MPVMPLAILSGAEPFSGQGGALGVLVLHGFTGSPQSLRHLAETLADEGFWVELPLLPGHGTAAEDMVPTRFSDYALAAQGAHDELARRCTSVAVVGLSMGATLACWLAERHPEIRGLALVNPFVEPPAESYRDVLRGLLDTGIELGPGVGSDIAKEGARELAYDQTPLAAALSLFEGIDEVSARLGDIKCPVLVMSSREDHVVPSSSGDLLVESTGGEVERVWLDRSYHVATLDHDAQKIEELTVSFMRRVLGPTGETANAAGRATRSR
jgi:carboxylesterase